MENRLFKFGMYWRIIYGGMRILLGSVLIKLVDVPLRDLLYTVMNQELIEDPIDPLFILVNSFLQAHPLSITYFMAAYLIFWGSTDIVLSVCLLKHKLWAFPLSLWLIGLFVTYELYRLTETHSLMLLGVIGLDIVIMWFIYREYQKITQAKEIKAERLKSLEDNTST